MLAAATIPRLFQAFVEPLANIGDDAASAPTRPGGFPRYDSAIPPHDRPDRPDNPRS